MLECRVRSGTSPSLCGWSEYVSPSTPPKKYRVQSYTEDFYFCAGSQGIICNGDPGFLSRNHDQVTSSSSSYSSTTCGKTIVGTRNFGSDVAAAPCTQYPGPLSSSDAGHSADANMTGAPAQTGFANTAQSATSLTYGPSGACAFAGGTTYLNVTSGLRTWTLSDEDTEADAIARFQAANSFGSWLEVGVDCSVPACCLAKYEERTAGFSFGYQDAQFKVIATGLTPSTNYDALVRIYRREYGVGDYELYDTMIVPGTTDGSGNFEVTDDVPNDVGYETYAAWASVQLA